MKNITITVSGEAMTGKSTIAFLIAEFLSNKGAQINVDETDLRSEGVYLNIKKNKEEIIDFSKYKITLTEKQLPLK